MRPRTLLTLVLALILILGNAPLAGRTQDLTPAPPPPQAVPGVARPGGTLPRSVSIQFVPLVGGLADPVDVANAGDGSGRRFVVERIGRVRVVAADGTLRAAPFLDLRSLVRSDFFEQGLLGLAFHPRYRDNGRVYVAYTDHDDALVLAGYRVNPADPDRANPATGEVLLRVERPHHDGNHNGGHLRFGPDGYLYFAVGDGGPISGADPDGNGQNLGVLAGKLLRLDVDRDAAGQPYAIPPDNPFLGTAGARPEIWAFGLRNPWQFAFDRATGDLWIADVGQEDWEEVDFAPAGAGGGQNYGWNVMEGAHCFPSWTGDCPRVGVLPVAEYSHFLDGGSHCSISGFGVYRGTASPELDGIYFVGDFCSGTVWGVAHDVAEGWTMQEVLRTDLLLSGGGQDESGELYVTSCECSESSDYDPTKDPVGTVWQVVATDQVPDGSEVAPAG